MADMRVVALDSETSLVVEIHPGSCQLNDVRLALQSMGEALQYLLRDAHSGDCGEFLERGSCADFTSGQLS